MSARSSPRGARRAHLAGRSWPVVYIPIGILYCGRAHGSEVKTSQTKYGCSWAAPCHSVSLGINGEDILGESEPGLPSSTSRAAFMMLWYTDRYVYCR